MAVHTQQHDVFMVENHTVNNNRLAGAGKGTTAAVVITKAETDRTDLSHVLIDDLTPGAVPQAGYLARREATGTGMGHIRLPDHQTCPAPSQDHAISKGEAQALVGTGMLFGTTVLQYFPDTGVTEAPEDKPYRQATFKDNGGSIAQGTLIIDGRDSRVMVCATLGGAENGLVADWQPYGTPGTNTNDTRIPPENNGVPNVDLIFFSRYDKAEILFTKSDNKFFNMGSSGHTESHDILDPSAHTVAPASGLGVLYTTGSAVQSLRMTPDTTRGAPLLCNGTQTPMWGELNIAYQPWGFVGGSANLPGAFTATYKPLSEWAPQTLGVVVAADGVFLAYHGADRTLKYVELT